ncbi:MAG TPA: cation diffusion facilitator family transporter [Rhodocyclaceae bacterium]|nr:cation diffusion facilitator family transporter [Rhodocyclaceae bacterium]
MANQHSDHHHCSHGHHHGHGHAHSGRGTLAFKIAIVVNLAFVLVEFAYGFIANSTALMADAGHNLSDVLGLALAWGAARLGTRAPSERYTYGLRSTSILAALANAMLLFVACGAIALEALQRFMAPPSVAGITVSAIAAIGIVVNGLSAWLFAKDAHTDLNIRGAYLHMAADAAVSLGVMVAGIVIFMTGWNWLDPIISLAIVAVVLIGTWSLLRESVQLALNAVPERIDVAAVDAYLRQQPGVADIHDLHIWGMSTTESALTVHLVMPAGYPGDAFMDGLTHVLRADFHIHHATLQIEQGTTSHSCSLETH